MPELEPGTIAALGGLLGGIVLGFASRWANFCTLGSIEDAIFGGNLNRMRIWGLAIATGIIGTYLLDFVGWVDIGQSFYLISPTTLWATAVGGLVFGLGMSMVGTCGFGALLRIGGGDLKSIVTFLVMGITAYATLSGLTAYLRIGLFPEPEIPQMPQGIAHFAQSIIGGKLHWWAFAIGVGILVLSLASKPFLKKPRKIIAGILIGLCIVWGWIVTGIFAADDFIPYPLESFTFSAPLGESLMYLMTMTGSSLQFGIGATLGVMVGAFVTSLVQGYFRWEACDDPREFRRQITGGVLMGFGSVTALGCTVGQGMSAASTLALSAPVALLSIFCGAWIGLHLLVHGSTSEAMDHLAAWWREWRTSKQAD